MFGSSEAETFSTVQRSIEEIFPKLLKAAMKNQGILCKTASDGYLSPPSGHTEIGLLHGLVASQVDG